jgi:hypothetical protein
MNGNPEPMNDFSERMNGGMPPPPQSFPAEYPATVTLTLGAWNTVMSCIAKQPWDIADPLMQAIRQQIGQQLQQSQADADVPNIHPQQ